MRRLALVLAVLALCACTVISQRHGPDDWPRLMVREPELTAWEVVRHCYRYTPLWAKAMLGFNVACAEIDLRDMSCTVYAAPGDAASREHELDHCSGRDHVGSSLLRDLWARWKASMTAGGVRYVYVRHDGVVHTIKGER